MQTRRTVVVLCVNGVLLLTILLVIVARRSDAQQVAPQVPPNLSVMPAQLSPNTWGCYVIDPQNQTLCVYQFSPGEHDLRLAAARSIQYDRQLGEYNTSPSPNEIRKMIERAQEPVRVAPTTQRSPESMPQ